MPGDVKALCREAFAATDRRSRLSILRARKTLQSSIRNAQTDRVAAAIAGRVVGRAIVPRVSPKRGKKPATLPLRSTWEDRTLTFRRAVSLAQSSGKYMRAAIRHWKVAVAKDRATLTTAFSTLPRLPLYCRLTPTVSLPALAVPVSSITPMASGSDCSLATSLRHRRSTSSWFHLMDSRNRWSVRGATPCFNAIASTFFRCNSESNPRTYAAKSRRPLTPWKQSAKRARNWASIFPSDAISWSDMGATFRGFVVKQLAHGGSLLFGSQVKRDNSLRSKHLRNQNATKWRCPARGSSTRRLDRSSSSRIDHHVVSHPFLFSTSDRHRAFVHFAEEAFGALPKGTVAELLQPENQDKLAEILKYHVASGRVYSEDALGIESAPTVAGPSIKVSLAESGANINDARLVQTDIDASNGVIHVIDRVLLPSSGGPADGVVALRPAMGKATVRGTLLEAIQRGVPAFQLGRPRCLCGNLHGS